MLLFIYLFLFLFFIQRFYNNNKRRFDTFAYQSRPFVYLNLEFGLRWGFVRSFFLLGHRTLTLGPENRPVGLAAKMLAFKNGFSTAKIFHAVTAYTCINY